VPLSERDLPFFASVLAESARPEWTAHQLELAAMLARTMAELERESRLLRVEGSMISTGRGPPVVNPRKTAVQMHAASVLRLRRALALHAGVRPARDVARRRAAAKKLEAVLDNPLIAKRDADDGR
jgi:hypothetical protein